MKQLIVISLFLVPYSLFAEPWLANRTSQNCAGCHAPGRYNRPASKRRCTLSCQGCHVNPNGRGIRTAYGKWHQERWLRSVYLKDYLLNKKKPAPASTQTYLKVASTELESEETTAGEFLTTFVEDYEASSYDNSSRHWRKIIKSDTAWEKKIPKEDPYHIERSSPILATADFRYQLDARNGLAYLWPMALDVGARVRPIPSHVQLVSEARFMNPPTNGFQNLFNTAQVKSAYVMVNDLPYNSFIMHGIYVPLFGLVDPDHTSIASTMTGISQRSVFRVSSIGGSPNVPFGMFHLIHPSTASGSMGYKGFAANAGMRAVKYGASFMVSYWDVNSPALNEDRQMLSITGGINRKPIIINAELLRVARTVGSQKDVGAAFTIQNKFQIWRENYILLNFAFANTAPTLSDGSAFEWAAGIRSFVLSGIDFQLYYLSTQIKSGITTTTNSVRGQLHFYL